MNDAGELADAPPTSHTSMSTDADKPTIGELPADVIAARQVERRVRLRGADESPDVGEELTVPARLAAVSAAAGTFGAIIAASLKESCPQQCSGRVFTADESVELRRCYEILVDNLALGVRSPAPPQLGAPRDLSRFKQHACKMRLIHLVSGGGSSRDGVLVPIATYGPDSRQRILLTFRSHALSGDMVLATMLPWRRSASVVL